MMRGWLGTGILVIFLILGLLFGGIMHNAHKPTGELLEQAAEKALSGAFDEAVTLGMQAKHRWEKQWNGTATLADHNPMDDMDGLFAELEVYARTEEIPHFAACCKELAKRVEAVAEAHRFSWWNIL